MTPGNGPIILNGIDPLTGHALIAPLDAKAAAAAAVASKQTHPAVAAMADSVAKPALGLPFGVDPKNPKQAGWGLVFHAQEDPAVISAFDVLVKHRSDQIGVPARVKPHLVYDGEDFEDWLANLGVGPGDVNPKKVPFYLLVVGDPVRIPFEFTQLLNMNYALGRLHLDSAADYQRYAQAVVDYETSPDVSNTKEAVFFGTAHIDDVATNMSCEELVTPLADGNDEDAGVGIEANFKTTKLLAGEATKAALLQHLTRPAPQLPPALLFSATHGLGWPMGDARQDASQGALLCGDWKGLGFSPLPMTPDQYLTGSDIKNGNVRNAIAFLFACFGLGTPKSDRFSFDPPNPPKQLAPNAFFSPLPKALLSAANGPALAVIGHVERAWASSIEPPGVGPEIEPFQTALRSILAGDPVGMALGGFKDRFGISSGMLSTLLAAKLNQSNVDDQKLADTWTLQNDSGAYLLFGDPAIRLRLDKLQ